MSTLDLVPSFLSTDLARFSELICAYIAVNFNELQLSEVNLT